MILYVASSCERMRVLFSFNNVACKVRPSSFLSMLFKASSALLCCSARLRFLMMHCIHCLTLGVSSVSCISTQTCLLVFNSLMFEWWILRLIEAIWARLTPKIKRHSHLIVIEGSKTILLALMDGSIFMSPSVDHYQLPRIVILWCQWDFPLLGCETIQEQLICTSAHHWFPLLSLRLEFGVLSIVISCFHLDFWLFHVMIGSIYLTIIVCPYYFISN